MYGMLKGSYHLLHVQVLFPQPRGIPAEEERKAS